MPSCLWLERPGRWRAAAVGALLVGLMLPSLPLLVGGLAGSGDDLGGFGAALGQSIAIAACTIGVSLVVGLPGGIATALYEYPLRRLVLALAILPPFMPPFLLSIGWSSLTPSIGGVGACAVVFVTVVAPLVLLATYATTRSLPGSLIDAARLAGGKRAAQRAAWRHAAPAAALAAGLGGVLTLSDPGPGQVFGVRTAASEILVSFAAQYNFQLAARQCLVLSAIVLGCSALLLWQMLPRLGVAMLARPLGTVRRSPGGLQAWGSVAPLTALVLVGVLAPMAGLVRPLASMPIALLANQPHADLIALWSYREAARTVANTLLYGVGAATVSIAVALVWALAAGRNPRLLAVSVWVLLALLALPAAAGALGVVRLGSMAPSWADVVMRGRATVCVALGLRLAPVAALLMLRAYAATSPTCVLAAALHGVGAARYVARVLLPMLLPSVIMAALLVALLATADVTSVLLLSPPGEPSLPLTIFTVMANAPEYLVAGLCLAYVAFAGAALLALWPLAARV